MFGAFVAGFWVGVLLAVAATWISTHPEQRDALWSRIRGKF